MTAHITVSLNGKSHSRTVAQGMPIKDLLSSEGWLKQPCGIGKCGKCLIYTDTVPCEAEERLLGKEAIAAGMRLACYTKAQEGMSIAIPPARATHVLTSFYHTPYTFQPIVQRCSVDIPEANLDDQRSCMRRLLDSMADAPDFGHKQATNGLSLEAIIDLPAFTDTNPRFDILHQDGELLAYGPSEEAHGIIIDIGTTTVAALLMNLENRRIVASLGEHNKQAVFGADVISRIHHLAEWQKANADHQQTGPNAEQNPVQKAICGQLDTMIAQLLQEAHVTMPNFIMLTGNSTMLHLLCGLPAFNMSKAPFIPTSIEAMRLSPHSLRIKQQCPLYLMPGISGYIGADIVASLLAANGHKEQAPFVLIDLGTNAETVLFANNTFYACSAAAGPCFEGASLSCGMAGQGGAIDSVFAVHEDSHQDSGLTKDPKDSTPRKGFGITTIENRKPIGLCGSGVIDAVALLLDSGILDETGRLDLDNIDDVENAPLAPHIAPHIAPYIALDEEGNASHFVLAEGVHLTKKDIREVQLAKSAVCAGIEILLQEAGLAVDDVATLYLAGGFGSSLNPATAARIGLFPTALESKVKVLGNSASFGALRYVTEENAINDAQDIIRRAKYLELSNHAAFADSYIENMIFPD